MSHEKLSRALLLLVSGAMAPMAWADLYQAVTALEKQDYARAFELYRELAEIGHTESQENLATFYVNGEGVPRDNVVGYAWAQAKAVGLAPRLDWNTKAQRARLRAYQQGQMPSGEIIEF